MRTNRFYISFSILILVVLGYLTYEIFLPFINAIMWAIVGTIVFYPIYKFILKIVKSKPLASALTLFLAFLLIVGPFFSLFFVLLDEVKSFAEQTDKGFIDSVKGFLSVPEVTKIVKKIQSFFGIKNMSLVDIIQGNVKKFGQDMFDHLSIWIGNIAKVALDFVFMGFTMFFLLKDGGDFLERLRKYLPFSETQREKLRTQIKDMIVTTVYGGIIVAAAQGTLGGIAFFALGIGSPVFWGFTMAVASFLPLVGTSIIWLPVSIYLFVAGSYAKGIILALFGMLVIGIIDNILRPIIISGRTKVPTLMIFFSIIGGINLFGFIGFIIGPLVVALFISVFTIFSDVEGASNT
jgi:predicted PurR-regulated permease PerM